MGKDSNKALELVRQSKQIQKPLVEQHNGKRLKEMGDGAKAQFGSATDAMNCAMEIQRTSQADFEVYSMACGSRAINRYNPIGMGR